MRPGTVLELAVSAHEGACAFRSCGTGRHWEPVSRGTHALPVASGDHESGLAQSVAAYRGSSWWLMLFRPRCLAD
jgi:hypothetical protein